MPGLMMPRVKCLISNGVEEVTASTQRAEREGYSGSGVQASTVCVQSLWFTLLLGQGDKCSGMRGSSWRTSVALCWGQCSKS